jgi:hydrogenase/urease accessory protein HupE
MVCLVAFAPCPIPVAAHDFTPGVLAIVEVETDVFRAAWTPPVDSGVELPVTPRFPPACTTDSPPASAVAIPGSRFRLDCAQGLRGEIAFDGLEDHRARVVVSIRRLDGRAYEHIVAGSDPRIDLDLPRGDALGWLTIGIEHVLGGPDHLVFVLGLLLVTNRRRQIITAVTAFTAAHSLTLALAALEVVRAPGAAVEATIAASIVLVAREALRPRAPHHPSTDSSWTQRYPWIVAFVFGLVHGLGFAGAIREIGLPESSFATALVLFNLGVEAGQLAVVAVALVIGWAVRRWRHRDVLRTAVTYAIGTLGAWWLVERTSLLIAGAS